MLREQHELAADDAAGKAILVRIAGVQEGPLDAIDEAILTWRTVAEADPRDPDAFEALNRLLTREARWGELIDLLEAEREADGVTPAEADALALRIAEILAERLGQQAQVIEIHGEILDRPEAEGGGGEAAEQARQALEALLTDPEHRLAASRILEGWYTRREAWSALARILELQIGETEDRHDRLDLLKRLGQLQQDTLGKAREAFGTYGRALAEDPHDGDVLAALELITEDQGLHPELADLLEARVSEVLDVGVALDLYRRLARLVDQQLGVPVRAVAAWQAVLRAEPFDAEALEALERLYTQEEDWPALINTLRRRIDEGSAENQADLQCKLGYLLEVVETDPAAALELYRAVLWDHPAHPVALPSVERLAGDLDHRRVAAEILEPLYRDAGEWAKLALLTEMRIELASEPEDRARLWLQSAELREEQLSDPASAFSAALQGYAEAPTLEEARERVLRLGTAQGEWPQLVAAFELGLEAVEAPDVRLEDHLRLAAWSHEHLADHDRAVLHYEAALEVEPENGTALDALEALHRDASDWAALAAVIARRAELAFDLDVRRARLMELGTLRATKLDDAEGAAQAWTGVLALEETDAEALAALEALYQRRGQWADLCGILQRQAESTYEEDPLVALHMRIGDLALTRLADGQRAAHAFERVLEIRPDDAEAIRRLRDLYTDEQAWLPLQEVLLKALAAADDDDEARAEVHIALARNADAHLERPEVAAEHFRQALIIRPADAEVTDRLAVLYRKAERWFELVEVLREHLEAVRAQATPARRVELLVAIAEVAQARLFDADLAIECLNEVLATDPTHGRARLVLAGLYERSGDWDKAAEALEKVAGDAQTAEERGTAWRQLGLLYRDRLDRPEAALQAFERAVAECGDADAVDALIALARADGDDARLAELLARQLKGLEGVARAPVLRELAQVQGKIGDEAGRVAALQEARTFAPDDLEVADALVEALVAAGRLDEAEPILRGIIDDLKANRRFRDLFRFNFRLGNVAEARGDEDQALEAYTACFEFDATWLPNLMKLGRLHYRRSDWNNALRVFQTALLHQMKLEREERAELFYHLGQIRLALEEPRKAKDMFGRALAQVPDHAPSREALEKL
ncbi:MAG: tetratricopeptide repeat protein [bacterium]